MEENLPCLESNSPKYKTKSEVYIKKLWSGLFVLTEIYICFRWM
jgi:hypothetical protein